MKEIYRIINDEGILFVNLVLLKHQHFIHQKNNKKIEDSNKNPQ